MYLNDEEFIDFLKKIKPYLYEDANIFIKENCQIGHKTEMVRSEFKDESDCSFVRSATCFKYIFSKAGYVMKDEGLWDPSGGDYQIQTLVLKPAKIQIDRVNHLNCVASNIVIHWDEAKPPSESKTAKSKATPEKFETPKKRQAKKFKPEEEFKKE